jgi:predicted nuclease of predicted toxin-antitoxin system
VMRLYANENIPGDCIAALRAVGYDVKWIREDRPGAADESVIEQAMAEQRLLLTFDKDFGELVFLRGKKAAAGIILFRIAHPSALAVTDVVLKVLASRDDWAGHFSVVDDRAIRMRPLR